MCFMHVLPADSDQFLLAGLKEEIISFKLLNMDSKDSALTGPMHLLN